MADEKQTSSPDSELKVPEWINTALIQKALQNSEKGNLQVQDISVKLATAPGDNYASIIYRVRATLSDGSSRSYLVKGPAPGVMGETTELMDAFKREGLMLGEIIPQIEALLEEAAPGRFPPFAARCPLYGSDPVKFVVLEDLQPAGFKMADRKRGLDLRHSLLALQTLARFHAGSHALLRKKPDISKLLPNPWLQQMNEGIVAFVEGGIQMAADACRSWPGYEEYADLLEAYKRIAISTGIKIAVPKPGEFTVINHCDFWVNNMMFQYEDGYTQPQGYRMVDFQGCTEASPALDLLYFYSTSVTDNVSAHHENLLLREYHSTLEETLRLLKLQAPSFETFLKDLDAHGPFALTGTLNVIPIVRAQRPVKLEESIAGNANAISHLYEDPVVKKWMQRVLPEYKRKGWIPS